MEVKATLMKPFSGKERADFIFENNIEHGYFITEFDDRLEASWYTEEELEEKRIQDEKNRQIEHYKELLAQSDYQAIKYAEGWLTEEEYAPIKALRQSYREAINELEGE